MSIGTKAALIAFAAIAAALIFRCVLRRGGGRAFILSALQGAAAMFAVNVAGAVTGIRLAVNAYSAAAACVCGLPGVAGMLLLKLIFK